MLSPALKDPIAIKAIEAKGEEPSSMSLAEFAAFSNEQSDLSSQICLRLSSTAQAFKSTESIFQA